jgi:ubiquinone/menaquinone biosynthesis C-methylase UbiE
VEHDHPGGVLLLQTLLTAASRRHTHASVPLRQGTDVLDLGTGFGVMAFELAKLVPIQMVGVDNDKAMLEAASAVAGELGGWLPAGSSVTFQHGEATDLPFADASFDLVTSRLVFQHLADPSAAASEIERVLRPGGFAHLFDVDDGLGASYPRHVDEFEILERTYAAWQSARGGDRRVGRKLPSYLNDAGLSVVATYVTTQAHFGLSGEDERRGAHERFASASNGLISAGLISAGEFDRCLAAIADEPATDRFHVESQVIVVAGKIS